MNNYTQKVELILSVWLHRNDDTRQILASYNMFDYKSFKQLATEGVFNMTRNINGMSTKLPNVRAKRVVERIKYIRFYKANNKDYLTADSKHWDMDNFKQWK